MGPRAKQKAAQRILHAIDPGLAETLERAQLLPGQLEKRLKARQSAIDVITGISSNVAEVPKTREMLAKLILADSQPQVDQILRNALASLDS